MASTLYPASPAMASTLCMITSACPAPLLPDPAPAPALPPLPAVLLFLPLRFFFDTAPPCTCICTVAAPEGRVRFPRPGLAVVAALLPLLPLLVRIDIPPPAVLSVIVIPADAAAALLPALRAPFA